MTKVTKYLVFWLSLMLIFTNPILVFAGTDGKIAGVITDAETGEPLPGTNVFIEGLPLGAAVDADGFYVILQIHPGEYTVIAKMIGYKELRVTGVEVSVDATTKIDFKLITTVLEGEVIIVEAKKPIIRPDISATQIELSGQLLQDTPAGNIREILLLQPGFEISQDVDKGSGISIRGGDIRESDFRIDDISMKSNLTDVSFLSIPKTSIKNIQLLTGGFNAEYGQVRSGLLNVITAQGSDKYELKVEYRHAYPQYKHFGPDAYDKNGRIWQIFAGEQAFTGTTEDDIKLFYETDGKQGYPLAFAGWNAISANYSADDDPDNDLTPQAALELWKWRHRPVDYADEADYDVDATLSGPIPFLKNSYFSTSYRREQKLYAYPLSMKKATSNMFTFKAHSQVTDRLKLGLTGIYGDREGTSPARTGGAFSATGVAFPGSYGALSGLIAGDQYSSRWTANAFSFYDMYTKQVTLSTGEEDMLRLSLDATYVFNPKTYLKAKYTYGENRRVTWRQGPRDTTPIKQIGDRMYDEQPWGTYGVNLQDQTGYFAVQGHARRFENTFDWLHQIKFDLVSQINKNNQLKTGMNIDVPIYKVRSMRQVKESSWAALGDTLFGDWHRLGNDDNMYEDMDIMYELEPRNWQWWDESPLIVGYYIQDKIEFEGMITNIGLRVDYHNPRTNAYEMDLPWDLDYTTDKWSIGDEIWWSQKRTEKVKSKIYFQPRIGVSFPITVKSKVYFNYGHFYQTPYPYYWYSYATPLTGPGFVMPTPELESPRTVAYELGVEQNIADMFLVHIAGYYKDITGEQQLKSAYDWDHIVANQYWDNNLYKDIRGVELRLSKPWGRYLTFWANYNYLIMSNGYTSLPEIYENPLEAESQEENANQVKPRSQPKFRAGLTIRTPEKWGFEFMGTRPLGGWLATFLNRWDDGGEWVWDPQLPTSQQHWIEGVDFSNTDLKLEKRISFGSINATFFLDIQNLWNQKILYTGHFTQEEALRYREALHLPWEEGEQKGDDKWGEWDKDYIQLGWKNWMQFLNPRQIFFGFRFDL